MTHTANPACGRAGGGTEAVMRDPAALLALADRVEREEPSRALDAEVAVACRIIPEFDPTTFIVPVHYRVDERRGTGYVEAYWVNDGTPFPVHSRAAPLYTTSIDAAATLVSDSRNWLAGKGRTRPDEPLYGAQIFDGTDAIAGAESNASTAAALCAAALRVLAMEADGAA